MGVVFVMLFGMMYFGNVLLSFVCLIFIVFEWMLGMMFSFVLLFVVVSFIG